MRLLIFLVMGGVLFGQADIALTAKKVAGLQEAEAKTALQDYFTGRALGIAVLKRVQAENRDLAAQEKTARELARARAEMKGNAAARLRAGSARMFRETGSANLGGGGSTLAVAKTSATEFLSLAMESGAVTSSTDKSTVTFQVNALPVWQVMSQGGGPYGCGGIQTRMAAAGKGTCESGAGFWLRGLTGSASFNVNSKETAVPVLGTAAGGNTTVVAGIRVLTNPSKLSGLGFKYELFQRETDRKAQTEALSKMAETLNSDLAKSGFLTNMAGFLEQLEGRPFYSGWLEESMKGAMAVRTDETKLAAYLQTRIDEGVKRAMADKDGIQRDAILEIQKVYETHVNKIAELEATHLFKKSMAFDFVHSRPTDQPFLNTIRLDLNTPLGEKVEGNTTGASASLDFNAGVTMYHQVQALQGKNVRLRNASASMALNYRMASWGEMGSPVLTLAGYYQYMFQNGLIEFNSSAFTPGAANIPLRGPALEVLNTKGAIGLGQLRLEIPLGKDSGLTFPLAFSYANRTELIKDPNRKYWQGHIGLSYDLSKLQEAFLKKKQPE